MTASALPAPLLGTAIGLFALTAFALYLRFRLTPERPDIRRGVLVFGLVFDLLGLAAVGFSLYIHYRLADDPAYGANMAPPVVLSASLLILLTAALVPVVVLLCRPAVERRQMTRAALREEI